MNTLPLLTVSTSGSEDFQVNEENDDTDTKEVNCTEGHLEGEELQLHWKPPVWTKMWSSCERTRDS